LKKYIITICVLFAAFIAKAQDENDTTYTISAFISNWNHPNGDTFRAIDSVDQMIVVFRERYRDIKIAGVEKENGIWKLKIDPAKASIGRNGLVYEAAKKEGDGCTPAGIFELGALFSYENSINSRLPFTQTSSEDKWIDDPASDDYNKHIRGETSAKSFENLLLKSIYYKYCMVIEYNTKPVVKGKGSAIFFHVADEKYSPTAGCVAVAEIDMLQYLNWLQPDKRKAIFIIADEEDEED
jgi:L,D-peptidoglycan transpeptidase YkuD (ErfK/YbiS/YcfS/YnhG family)